MDGVEATHGSAFCSHHRCVSVINEVKYLTRPEPTSLLLLLRCGVKAQRSESLLSQCWPYNADSQTNQWSDSKKKKRLPSDDLPHTWLYRRRYGICISQLFQQPFVVPSSIVSASLLTMPKKASVDHNTDSALLFYEARR